MNKFRDEVSDYGLEFLSETEAAWKVSEGNSDDEAFWLPKSRCEIYPENAEPGGYATFTIPNWLAEEKGLLG